MNRNESFISTASKLLEKARQQQHSVQNQQIDNIKQNKFILKTVVSVQPNSNSSDPIEQKIPVEK